MHLRSPIGLRYKPAGCSAAISGPIAHLGERRFCKAEVFGSSPNGSTKLDEMIDLWRAIGRGQGALVSGIPRRSPGEMLAEGGIPRADTSERRFIQSPQLGEGAIHGPDREEGAG